MTKYILDTNIVSALGAGLNNDVVSKKLQSLPSNDIVSVSVLTVYEENYGLKNSNNQARKQRFKENLELVLQFFEIISLDLKEMGIFAELKVAYKNHTGITKKDAKKNDIDLLIASSAIAENAVLVSNDKIFETLAKIDPRLRYENWLK